MEIRKVGVMGCGAMGVGVAQVCAQAGIPTVAVKATPGSTDKIRSGLEKSLAKMVERQKMSAELRDSTLGLLQFTTDESAVADCDLIIESIIEDIDIKKAMFKRLEGIVTPQAILATNTSTLSVTALMAGCKQRDRVAGLHFFNPAPVMKLVEIIHGFETSDEVISTLDEFCKKVGKDPVIVQDTTGFIVNRLLTPYMLSAIHLLEMGTGTIADIDHAMKSGAAHPMGPFELADYIGLDVVEAMALNIYEDVRQPHVASPHTLTRLVQLGYLGRKTGKGFYDYSVKPPIGNPALRHPVA
ncbi:MAG: 3-hydroxyacyl-CoA dehydrogenase family protein [Propionivibrio sp.]|uniref:3-hydroxyacyl-CoA dehydrogenase family protein n=1 Tax=Propionivibrio sp. TaxID=2212460 RepID=UPI001A36A1A0|nr:3-hydroxyacyl-CoA dehydrogenase family protein [Propionivibrio sp.]MBL8416387.1 3-hydroxyacyl-CoA dehydrogenase family protein [Propionivibrio sp.]